MKRHKPLNSSLVVGNIQTEVGQYSIEFKHAKEEIPGTADGFPALANRGNMNNYGTEDDMA